MAYTVAAATGVPITLQDAKSSGNGVVIAIPPNIKNHKIIIKTSAGVNAGAIQPETADAVDYAGTWAPIGGGPITCAVASIETEYSWTGTYQFFRARISTGIGVGTVTVIYVGS